MMKTRERTAMFIGRTGILLPEWGEFGVDVFYLVLSGNYTMGESLEESCSLLMVMKPNISQLRQRQAEHVILSYDTRR